MINLSKLPLEQNPSFYILPLNYVESIQISENILKSNPNYSSDYVLEYDKLGFITYCNPSACKKLGFLQTEIINKHFTEFISVDHLEKVNSFFVNQYVQKIPSCYLEFKAITKNKDKFWISQKSILKYGNDGVLSFKTVGVDLENKKIQGRKSFVEEENIEYNTNFNLTNFSGSKILIVEDDKISQLVASTFLQRWGYDFDIAESGIEAIKMANEYLYYLILMDVQLPEIDGFETCSYIRNHLIKPYSQTPIIVFTASHLSKVQEKLKDAGVNGFITKPFNPMELKNIVLNHISKWKLSSYYREEENKKELIDLSYLYEISNGSNEFVKSIITVFVQQTPAHIVALKEACNQLNWHEIGQIVHKIKATFYTMGITSLEPVIESLEELVEKKCNLNLILFHIDRLDKICNKVYYELELKLTSLSN